MKKLTTRQIALNGVVAGLYAAITILTASFAYGNIQFRIADSLCVLVVLEPSLTVGLTLGCLIALMQYALRKSAEKKAKKEAESK